jgi:protein-disulfide isomerase
MTSRAQQRGATRRRLAVIIGAVALALAAVVIARDAGDQAPATAQPVAATDVFAGLPQDGITLGAPSAPATLIEFADLQCPWCGVYGRDVLPAVVDRYARSGALKLELHLLAFLGEDSVRAGEMAAAAADHDRLWQFTDAFYAAQGEENSGYVTDAFLRATASRAGLGAGAVPDGASARRRLDDAEAEASRLGVQGTPAFFLRRGDGEPVALTPADMTPAAFIAALDVALRA